MSENNFTAEQLEKALLNVDDLFDRCLLGEKYFLLGDTGMSAHTNTPLFGRIEVGIEDRYLTPEVRSTIKDYAGAEEVDGKINYAFEGVPVEIKVIKRKYKFLENPEPVIYGFEDYQLPNPYDRYFTARYLLK